MKKPAGPKLRRPSTRKKVKKSTTRSTAERIVKVATRVFAEKGYEGTSTKEICRLAGVNLAAIHYHFKSKENLYKHIISGVGTSAIESAVRVLQPAANLEEFKARLKIFLSEAIAAGTEQPDVSLMIIRDAQTHGDVLVDIFKKTFGRIEEALTIFVSDAQKKGLLKSGVPTKVAVGFIHAQLIYAVGNQKLFKRIYGFELSDFDRCQEWLDQFIEIFVDGFRIQKS